MNAVISLDAMLDRQQVWQGRHARPARTGEPTGWAELDAALPTGGWPCGALTEVLLPADGVGELRLVLPTLARLTRADADVAVIAPPYQPYAPGWQLHGVDMTRVDFVEVSEKDALWAMEQCLRSGSYRAVLGWPVRAEDRAFRRLQVAADAGSALGFAFRGKQHAVNPSPAALRLELESRPQWRVRVRKCRGGQAPVHPIGLRAVER